jgi:hypothetical protein
LYIGVLADRQSQTMRAHILAGETSVTWYRFHLGRGVETPHRRALAHVGTQSALTIRRDEQQRHRVQVAGPFDSALHARLIRDLFSLSTQE